MKKKIAALLLALAMAAGAAAAPPLARVGFPAVSAAGETSGAFDGVTWRLNKETGVLTISCNDDVDTDAGWWDNRNYDEYPWWNGWSDNHSIKKVMIENGVTSIGDAAFEHQSGIEEISLPDSLTYIGNYAFYGCESLKKVVIPDSVTTLGNGAFEYCTSLTEANFPATVTTLNNAFNGCYNLTGLTFPQTVTAIEDRAFHDCKSLPAFTVPDTVTSIGDRAFGGCDGLTGFTVDSGNPNYAAVDGVLFDKSKSELLCYPGGKKDSTYTIPSSTHTIVPFAFSGTQYLKSIIIPSTFREIPSEAFSGLQSVESVTIPNSVTTIGSHAFAYSKKLKSITIPDSVTSLGEGAFSECLALKEAVVGNAVTSLTEAFYLCQSLRHVTLGRSVKEVDSHSFYVTDMESIEVAEDNPYFKSVDGVLYSKDGTQLIFIPRAKGSYVVPASVQVMKEGCAPYYSLGSVTVLNPECVLEDWAVEGIPIIGYKGSTAERYATGDCGGYGFIDIENQVLSGSCGKDLTWSLNMETGKMTISGSGAMAFEEDEYGDGEIPWRNYLRSITEVTFTGKPTSIADVAFGGCRSLAKITIPTTVKSIGWGAFYNTALTDITIPDSVTTIGEDAFSDCSKLKKVKLPHSLTSLGESAFGDCESLTDITLPASLKKIPVCAFGSVFDSNYEVFGSGCASLTAMVIPDGVTSIGARAFMDCKKLKSIVIPDTVTAIGEYTFYGCDSLTDVYYKGSEADWQKIVNESDKDYVIGNIGKHTDFRNHLTGVTLHYDYGKTPLAITAQPSDASGAVNDSVSFTVQAEGEGLTYQWYVRKSGDAAFTKWNNKTAATVSTPVYASWNNAQFYCLIQDRDGQTAQTNTVKLIVTPKITVQPANASGEVNGTAKFSVTATGAGLSYQWYYKKANESSFTAWNKKTASSVSTTIYKSWDGAQFYCLVKDVNGKTVKSNTVTLTVKTPLAISTQPANTSGAVNDTAKFSVTATGTGLSYQWYIKKSGESSFTAWNKKTSASVSTPIYASWNNAQFYCIVKDANGASVKSNTVKLTVTPKLTAQPVNASGAVNANVSFTVKATGAGLSYQWYVRKSGDSSFTAWNKKTSASVSTPVYASWNNAQFYCVVKDANGKTVQSNTVKLTVTPKITSQPSNASGTVNGTAKFTVTATGSGLTYQWYYRKSGQSDWTAWNNQTKNAASLTLYKSWNDAQFYCVVKDANGKTVKSATAALTVK